MGGAPVHVLVVEDQPADAKLVEIALASEPPGTFRVSRASRVSEALDRLASGDIDVVLTDLGLPDSDGVDGVVRLRRARPDLPVVVLSGSDDPERRRAALVAGAAEFERKRIFPPGYLGPLLLRAIHRERFARTLADPEWQPGQRLPEPPGGPDPAVVLIDGRLAAWTTSAETFVDRSASPSMKLVAPLDAALSGPDESSSAAVVGPIRVGECLLTRADGRRESVRYLGRRVGAGELGRSLVFLSGAAPERLPDPRESPRQPAVPSSDRSPALDPTAWAELQELAGTNDRFLPELARSFLQHAPALLREIRRASTDADPSALERAAHALKSTSSQVAALRLAELCRRLEEVSRGSRIPTAGVSEVEAEFERVAAELRAVTGGRP